MANKSQENTYNTENYRQALLAFQHKEEQLGLLLSNHNIAVFEYDPARDVISVYDHNHHIKKTYSAYLTYLETRSKVHPDDRQLLIDFFLNRLEGPLEIRICKGDCTAKKILDGRMLEGDGSPGILLGISRDVTLEKQREEILLDQVQRDPLTHLYNLAAGRELIDQYLCHKTPYASCGLMVIDLDYFKTINDLYGHLFGNTVLMDFSALLSALFSHDDILVRAGGDEFVVFLKNVSRTALMKKAMYLVNAVPKLAYSDADLSLSCSVGVCFLPENISGYSYEQLFENADWALYRAKEKGKNRYEFCDHLKRFSLSPGDPASHPLSGAIDARYLHNDVIATAFELFEKTANFELALNKLLNIIGIRFHLDRITVVHTRVKEKQAGRSYQWTALDTPKVLESPSSFTREDFLTLFNSYDEYGTTVLQHDYLSMYSQSAQELLVQGNAKTVLYAAMYCEGQYTGAISYVVCSQKRYWSKQQRSQLSEITRIISAHLAKSIALNAATTSYLSCPDCDSLTGLISFPRFREEVEQLIVGQRALSHVMVYSDFVDFKYFNRKYGYSTGDQVLKEYCNYVIANNKYTESVYFTRVVADQFILFTPCDSVERLQAFIESCNHNFTHRLRQQYPLAPLNIRTGIYPVQENCSGASAAIDAANYARRQVTQPELRTTVVFDQQLEQNAAMQQELANSMEHAMASRQFKVYMQPKVSLTDFSVIGAEALVRWEREDGTLLPPERFIPLFEQNGMILELDFYVFRHVAAFLAKNNDLGRTQYPISINASILHAAEPDAAARYVSILKEYNVDPSLTEIELTETGAAENYGKVRQLFSDLQKARLRTSLDDFGSGYSLLNTVMNIPVHSIKLDRKFVHYCKDSEKGILILTQLIDLLKRLGHNVVCEGIETEEQMLLLKNIGCPQAQGDWFAKPMPLEEYEAFVYGDA